MTDQGSYELHTFSTVLAGAESSADDAQPSLDLPWQDDHCEAAHVLKIPVAAHAEKPCRVRVDEQGRLVEAEGRSAVAEFYVVQRRLGTGLAMIARKEGILVNGLPALRMSVLSSKDALLLAPGLHTYITERFRPYIGKPTPELVGKKCPFCRIPFDKDTRLVTHRCGVAYHYETAESHPDVGENDRLNCFEKVRSCLSCGRAVTLEEELTWDPAALA